nr:reverse transcriptase domain-containing protein [Tanacetum cinerariifolium]
MLRACPHHGFTELAQIDTFYNGLNDNDQDSLNAAAGENLLSKTTREALKIIKNKSKVRYSRNKSNVSRMNTNSRENASKSNDRIDKLADQNFNLVDIFAKKVVTPAPVKAVKESCVTYGGTHAYYNCPNTDSNQPSVCVATGTYNQVAPIKPENASKSNDRIDKLADQIFNLVDIFAKKVVTPAPVKAVKESYVTCGGTHAYCNCPNTDSNQPSVCVATGTYNQNQASTSGTLSSNTIPNPKGEMKAITTYSSVAYEGPSIPTNPSPKKVVKQETDETTDKEQTNFQGSTAHVQPSVTPILEPDVPKTLPEPNIPYPLRLNDQKLREKATNQMEKFFQIFQDLHFDIGFADALLLMLKFASTIKSFLTNKDKLFNINLMPLSIWKKLSLPELTPTRMTLELADRSITRPKGVTEDVFVKVGKFHFPTDFVVVDFEADPCVPLILGRSFLRTGRALIDVYGEEITLRVNDEAITFNLNQTTRYLSPYDDLSVNQIDIIDVSTEEHAQEILGFSNNSSGGNPTSTFEPIISDSSPSLTLFEGSDFIFEEIEANLKDELISPKIDDTNYDSEGHICLIEKLLNNYLFQLSSMDLKQGELAK